MIKSRGVPIFYDDLWRQVWPAISLGLDPIRLPLADPQDHSSEHRQLTSKYSLNDFYPRLVLRRQGRHRHNLISLRAINRVRITLLTRLDFSAEG